MNYFALTNDPDHGQLDNYRKIFRELGRRNIFVTTAVFCALKDDGSDLARHCFRNETHCLEETDYRNFMLELKEQGHEIALHGYSQVSDTRDEFQKGLDIFKATFGEYPRIYIEHGGHPKSHPPGLCKKENLKAWGGLPDNPYFIKDIVRDVFDLVWTHNYLMDDVYLPMASSDIFHEEDGITYFKRWPMTHIETLAKNLSRQRNTIVGYTHFGYRGYEMSRYIIKDYLRNRRARLKWWSDNRFRGTAKRLARVLERNSLKSVTLSQLLKISCGKTVS